MHVLIVEDNPTNLAVVKAIVGKIEGCTFEAFSNAPDALSRALQINFDLVIADHLMPAMTGSSLVAALRTAPAYVDIPMIVVTADSDRKVRHEAIFAGATDFLNKPIDPLELKERVKNLLALRRDLDVKAL